MFELTHICYRQYQVQQNHGILHWWPTIHLQQVLSNVKICLSAWFEFIIGSSIKYNHKTPESNRWSKAWSTLALLQVINRLVSSEIDAIAIEKTVIYYHYDFSLNCFVPIKTLSTVILVKDHSQIMVNSFILNDY